MVFCCFSADTVVETKKLAPLPLPLPLPSTKPVETPVETQVELVEDDYSDMPPLIRCDEPDMFKNFVDAFECINCNTEIQNDRLYIKYESPLGKLDIVVYNVGDTKFISLNDHSIELETFNQIANVEAHDTVEHTGLTTIEFKNDTSILVNCPINIIVRALSDNLYNVPKDDVDEEPEDTRGKTVVYLLSLAIIGIGFVLPYTQYYDMMK